MTITGVGIRLDLEGPPPVAPPHSLLQTPDVVVADGGRWLNGVNLMGFPDATPSLWEPCSEGTYRAKGEGQTGPMAQFDPFVVYMPITCSSLGWIGLQEMLTAAFDATMSMGIEQALAAGIPGSANPYFGDANLTILGATSVSPQVAISYLENAIGSTGRGGMIHATPAVVAGLAPMLQGNQLGDLRTANGTPVVSGDGYIDVVPDGESEPGGAEDYIFATGPVEVRLSPVAMPDLSESLDRSDNTLTFRAERYVLATWDTALQVGVLVDWSLCCGANPPV